MLCYNNFVEKKLLVLFDGNALVHRAYHALPPLTVSKTGEMVNAVYGVASMLLKVQTEAIADMQKHRDEHVQLSVDLYVAILTFDKEAIAEIMSAQLEKGFQKAQEKPPTWVTDMNAVN